MSTKFNAHINVEICTTVKACKNLYKYVYKGNDKIVHAVINQFSKFLKIYIILFNLQLEFYIIDEKRNILNLDIFQLPSHV